MTDDEPRRYPLGVSPPAIVIRIELEALPKAYADVMYEGEAVRLADWIAANPALERLVAAASAAWLEMTRQGNDDKFKL